MPGETRMHDESPHSSVSGADWASAWFDMLSKLTESMPPLGLNGLPPEIAQQARAAQLKWWSEYCDRVMRSPGFLEAMKDSMAATSRSRKQANDFLGEMQHALQGATREDIDHLSRSLRRYEKQVGAALRDIRRRLADLSRRVAALTDGRPDGDDPAGTAPADPRPAARNGRAKPRRRKKKR
jgi:hypothetical protein